MHQISVTNGPYAITPIHTSEQACRECVFWNVIHTQTHCSQTQGYKNTKMQNTKIQITKYKVQKYINTKIQKQKLHVLSFIDKTIR